MTCPVVLQIFFTDHEDVPDWIDPYLDSPIKPQTIFGLPLWMPEGKPVTKWAIDYVSASDERWLVLGPFNDFSQVQKIYLETFKTMPHITSGFRIINEHCFKWLHDGLPCQIWTDG